jgi:hypothetical protein
MRTILSGVICQKNVTQLAPVLFDRPVTLRHSRELRKSANRRVSPKEHNGKKWNKLGKKVDAG